MPELCSRLPVKVGDKVTKGQMVASVQNPNSLKNYAIFAPLSGEVTASYVSVGSKVSEQPLLEISDFSSVYVEMSAFPSDTEQLKLGQQFLVQDLHGHQAATQPDQLHSTTNDRWPYARAPVVC